MVTTTTYTGPIETTMAARTAAAAMSPLDFVDSHKQMWARQNGRKLVFRGLVEVEQVCNGYLVTISNGSDKPAMSYVADTLQEVNDIITAQMVCSKLEGLE
jgi:hypothetical protein